MISALACVPRGAARSRPTKDVPNEAELEQLKEQALATGALEHADGVSDDGDDDEAADADDQDGEGSDGADGNTVEAAVRPRTI